MQNICKLYRYTVCVCVCVYGVGLLKVGSKISPLEKQN